MRFLDSTRRGAILLVLSLLIAPSSSFSASVHPSDASANWPHWRGPADHGSTESGTYPAKFDANTNILWKVTLPGKGCSTPIVWQKRIYLTAPIDGQDAALAFDWDGNPLWHTTIGAEIKGKHRNGSGCNPSPVTDGEHLFVYFKSKNLAGLDLQGKVLWKTNLQDRYGKDTLYWDLGTSPVLTDKDVVIAVMQHGGSYLAAFDKLTGELHWKVSRDYETPVEGDHSYATPLVYKENGRDMLLVWGAEHLTAHDPANGKIVWSVGGFNPKAHNNWVCVASPVIAGDIVVVPYGRGAELHGIKLGGLGDVTATNRLWIENDAASFVPTPAEYKGRVYVVRDRGEVKCIDPATGKSVWAGQFPKKNFSYYSSPTLADGKLYAPREDGILLVAKVDGGFELLSENDMSERLVASPVPVGDRLFIRSEQHLFCIGTK